MIEGDKAEWVIQMRRGVERGVAPQAWRRAPGSRPRAFAQCLSALERLPPPPHLMAEFLNVRTGEEVPWPIQN